MASAFTASKISVEISFIDGKFHRPHIGLLHPSQLDMFSGESSWHDPTLLNWETDVVDLQSRASVFFFLLFSPLDPSNRVHNYQSLRHTKSS
jgi:hypothetical protein